MQSLIDIKEDDIIKFRKTSVLFSERHTVSLIHMELSLKHLQEILFIQVTSSLISHL